MPEVPDDEALFRGIRDSDIETHCPRDPVDGVRRISSNAFNDAQREPSVDLGSRCGDDPSYTAEARGPWVLGLTAGVVRSISENRADTVHYADVRPDPTDDNPAHGVIYGKPPFDSDKLFRRIKRALARESIWHIGPPP